MAGDDHPDKKMVAAGDMKGKGKEIAENLVNESTSDEETGGSIATTSIEVQPVKKSKIDNADQSAAPAPPAPVVAPPPAPAPAQAPPLQVPCPLCHRVFDSYPAMFGHQRVHKERTYRGAYPPPTFQREGSPHPPIAEETEEAARHAAQMLIEMSKGRFTKPAATMSIKEAGEVRGVSLDLNIPLEVEKSTDEEEEEEATEKANVQLDLNKSPPESE